MSQSAPLPPSQALTVLAGSVSSQQLARRAIRPESGFLAQIIASQSDVMQYRMRRRETPEQAILAYSAAAILTKRRLSVAA